MNFLYIDTDIATEKDLFYLYLVCPNSNMATNLINVCWIKISSGLTEKKSNLEEF